MDSNRGGFFVDSGLKKQIDSIPSLTISWEILAHKGISHTEKLLFVLIAMLEENNSGCVGTNQLFAQILDVHTRTICSGINNLSDKKLIKVEPWDGSTRRIFIHSKYRPLFSKPIEQNGGSKIYEVGGVDTNDKSVNNQEFNKELLLSSRARGKNLNLIPQKDILTPVNKFTSVNTLSGVIAFAPQTQLKSVPQSIEAKRREIPKTELLRMRMELASRNSKLEKKKKEPCHAPKETKALIDLWNTLGLRKHINQSSKTYYSIVESIRKLIKGTFFNSTFLKAYHNKSFTHEGIARSIRNFSLAANSMDHEPAGEYKKYLRHAGMDTFFYNPHAFQEHSLFLKYALNPPALVKDSLMSEPERNPVITKKLIKLYERSLGIRPSYTQQQINKFIKGANRLIDFHSKYKSRLSIDVPVNEMASCLHEALIEEYKDPSLIEIGHFCSDRTFNKLLPAYLNKSAMLKSME
jgi:hypothetical protein